jgi:two-component system sensor kinase FixL
LDELKGDSAGSEGILNRLMELSRIAALAEMASGIAHELNQPLGAIATFSQAGDRLLYRPEPLVPRAREVFQQINAEAMTAGEGIRRIRRLFDHAETTRTRCQISELVGELVPALHALARADRYAVETSITDSGPGVPADLADKLFRPFFTTKAGGTGLGLASSRASIEAHEGSIGFEKLNPNGSRFWFRLPIVTS